MHYTSFAFNATAACVDKLGGTTTSDDPVCCQHKKNPKLCKIAVFRTTNTLGIASFFNVAISLSLNACERAAANCALDPALHPLRSAKIFKKKSRLFPIWRLFDCETNQTACAHGQHQHATAAESRGTILDCSCTDTAGRRCTASRESLHRTACAENR